MEITYSELIFPYVYAAYQTKTNTGMYQLLAGIPAVYNATSLLMSENSWHCDLPTSKATSGLDTSIVGH